MEKVFITNHAFLALKRRAHYIGKTDLVQAVRDAIANGEAMTAAPDWYEGGKANSETRFVSVTDKVCAVIEPNKKGRGWAVITVANRR